MNQRNLRLLRTSVLTLIATLLIATTASGQLFTLRQTFDDPNVTTTDNFGASVAVDGSRILIGAQRDDTYGENVGQAHLFDATAGNLLQTFDDPTPIEGYFGHAVALDGDRVLIGNAWHDPGGEAHLFDTSGNLLHTFNDPTPAHDLFGRAVALDGNHILIAAPGDSTNGQAVGQVHLFDATTFNLLQTFDDPTPCTFCAFGSDSVALDGNRVVIGDHWDGTHGQYVGQAHLFDTSGNLLQTFDDPTVTEGNHFGRSVALDGNHVLIGSSGEQAHLFSTSGNLLQTFYDPTPPGNFGRAVALDGNRALIGDHSDNTHGAEVGQAHLFNATTGSLLQTFDDPTITNEDWFGRSVALDGNRVLIGAPHDETLGENVGQAHLFTPSCDFNSDAECDIDDLNSILAEGPIAPGVTVTPGVNDQFDLTGDGVIDNADVDQWLADAGTIDGFASPYKRADANLDGVVDGQDFILWNGGKFTSTLFWDVGDFDGDGVADGQDFILWNGNKFTSSDGVSAVPEPGAGMLSFVALILLAVARVHR